METILCKNCNFFRQAPNVAYCYNSQAENNAEIDLVYGRKDYYSCKDMRATASACGAEAKWFSQVGVN